MRAWVLGLVCVAAAGCTRFNPDFYDVVGDVDAAVTTGGNGGNGGNGGGTTACDPSRLATDPRHCGGCDNDCTRLPNVDPSRVSCTSGVCNVGGACLYNFADCTSDPGCETNIGTPEHCGSCTNACSGFDPFCNTDGNGHHQCAGTPPPPDLSTPAPHDMSLPPADLAFSPSTDMAGCFPSGTPCVNQSDCCSGICFVTQCY